MSAPALAAHLRIDEGTLRPIPHVNAAPARIDHVLAADRDVMTAPKQAHALSQALKAQVHRIPAAGHSMMAEAPDATLDALIAFLYWFLKPRREKP